MCSPLKGFFKFFPLKASRDSQRFRFWLRGVQFNSAVGCTPRSLALRYDAHRRVFKDIFLHDSVLWCPPRSLTPRRDAHLRVGLRRMMHTAELDSTVWCKPRSFLKIQISRQNQHRLRKYFTLFIRGPDGFETGKKMEVENLVTHSFLANIAKCA